MRKDVTGKGPSDGFSTANDEVVDVETELFENTGGKKENAISDADRTLCIDVT